MTTGLAGANPPEQIIILRALQLGDSLCAVPAWRALRAAYPQARITLIGLPWARNFARRFQYLLDDWLEFPGYPGFPERAPQIEAFPAFLTQVQQQRYDLALQMQGSGFLSNTLTVLLGAKRSAGFYLPGSYCPDPDTFLPYPDADPEVRRHLRLMEFLGLPLQGEDLEFPLQMQDEQEFQDLLRAVPEAANLAVRSYIVLHPGARADARRWPAERFARLGDALAAAGWPVILTGTADEAPLTAEVRLHMRHSALDLAGRTSLGALALLLRGASLLVCNDTGVSHVAAALKTPSLVLFLASDPQRWAPLDRDLHRIIPRAQDEPVRLVIQAALEQAAGQGAIRRQSAASSLEANHVQ